MGNKFNENDFKALLLKYNYTQEMLAEKLGIDRTTFWRKVKDSGNFSRKEIQIMIEIFSWESIKPIFFGN